MIEVPIGKEDQIDKSRKKEEKDKSSDL